MGKKIDSSLDMQKLANEIRLVEIRAVGEEDGKMILEGYAITYDQPATHIYGNYKFTEVIKRGALDTADMKDVPLRYNHNDSWLIIARTRNNSLQLIKDDIGLKIRAELIETQSNKDVYMSVKEKLIDKMSFAFRVADKGDTWQYGEMETIRTVTNIQKLYDVSVVDTPFYDTTSVVARSFELLESNLKQLESFDLDKRKLQLKYKYK
jgi:HK97 family phage prohead protease